MPIEFTSAEFKRPHKTEERYLYLRYLLLAIAGCSVVLYFSFDYFSYIYLMASSLVLLAPVEWLRMRSEGKNKNETTARQLIVARNKTDNESEPKPSAQPRKLETRKVAAPGRSNSSGSRVSTDAILIVAPACLACALIFVASYQAFQRQLGLGLGSTLGESIDLSFMMLSGVACAGLLVYLAVLLKRRYPKGRG